MQLSVENRLSRLVWMGHCIKFTSLLVLFLLLSSPSGEIILVLKIAAMAADLDNGMNLVNRQGNKVNAASVFFSELSGAH